jgi:hypothetical protein
MRPAEIQQAVYDAVNVSAVTTLLTSASTETPIWTLGAPQVVDAEAAGNFPYITLAFLTDDGFTTKDDAGSEALIQVDVWHRTPSELAIKAIARQVFLALHRVTLAGLTGHVTTECTDMEFMTEDDGITRRAMVEFRVVSLG